MDEANHLRELLIAKLREIAELKQARDVLLVSLYEAKNCAFKMGWHGEINRWSKAIAYAEQSNRYDGDKQDQISE